MISLAVLRKVLGHIEGFFLDPAKENAVATIYAGKQGGMSWVRVFRRGECIYG
jgi:hypothetical protein